MDETLTADVTAKVQALLPEVPSATVTSYVARAREYFCARTKRRAVPEQALWLWVDLSVALYRLQADAAAGRPIESIKRGDTAIQYGSSNEVAGLSHFNDRLRAYAVAVGR